MKIFYALATLALLLAVLILPASALVQSCALQGRVTDPSGAAVSGADVTLTDGTQTFHAKSDAEGRYAFHSFAPGVYSIAADSSGFAPFRLAGVSFAPGETKELNLPLAIAVDQQKVFVNEKEEGVSINPEQNSGAMVIKDSALDALSDDPNEMQSELEALAGPAAGPNGGQIYIDGFEGGQIPPKSSILEVRLNQNPFSAEYDRQGYGRVEIITKPGGQKFQGHIRSYGNSSYFNTANPFIVLQPSEIVYSYSGDVSGPIGKESSYSLNAYYSNWQDSAIVNALNPSTLTSNLIEAFPAPTSYININPRVDFQVAKDNFLSIRDIFSRGRDQGLGVGILNLPEQAYSSLSYTNNLQVSDTWVISPHFLMEPRFMWRRSAGNQAPSFLTPLVTIEGAFQNGGNSSGHVQDHQDLFTLQNYATATLTTHTLRFGGRIRAYRDANFSTSGVNGSYIFVDSASYQAEAPAAYTATVISNPAVRALLFDGSLFFQDDWRVSQRFLLGLGLRFEGQNRISDHADWAPRIAIAWRPGDPGKNQNSAKTVIRAGYGWFFNRFTVPTSFNPSGGTPYIIAAIHDNRINQKSYTIPSPSFYNPNAATPAPVLASAPNGILTYHTVDPHFQAAIDMQASIGVDRQIAKHVTGSLAYLYTQGVHQYLSNNISAPAFDIASYTVIGVAPFLYNYQFQSGGFYRQNQLILTSALQLKHITLSGNYMLNQAKSDTQGVTSFPSVAQDPGFDYGRANFDFRHRLFLVGSFSAGRGFVIAPVLAAQSGTPYNLTIGDDLTGNNQFNARPGYGVCGAAGVIQTQYGCLDTNPSGTGERIVPINAGTGPANAMLNIRVSKVFGLGARAKQAGEGRSYTLDNRGPSIRLDAGAPRRYNLTFIVNAYNALNIVNRATPNGDLLSGLFGQTESLASGIYSGPVSGNRSIFLQSTFNF